jgi:hypothetical protein
MNSFHNFKVLAACAAVVSIAAFGCSKDSAKGGGGAAAAKATGGAGLALFPKDANIIMGFNVASITSGSLFKEFAEPMIKKQTAGELAKVKENCGIDPMTALKSVTVAMKMNSSMEPDENNMFMVLNGIDRDKGEKCLEMMAKEEGDELTLTRDGKFTKVESKETFWVGWIDDTTVVTGGPKIDKAGLEARMAGKDGLDGNKEMMDLIGKTNQSASMWMAMQKPAGAQASVPMEFSGVYATVDTKSGLSLNGGMLQADADTAAKTVETVKAQMTMAKQQAAAMQLDKFVDKLVVEASDAFVIMKLDLSDADVKELVEKLRPMLGMFGM